MSNEEMILALLQAMHTDIQTLQTDVQEMKSDIQTLQTDVQDLKSGVAKANQEIVKINLALENDIRPHITLLAEGQGVLLQKMAPQAEFDELQSKVNFLETIVRLNTQEIEKLKKAE